MGLYDLPPFIVTSLGAAMIFAYFSLVFYKENPLSRWAEYSLIGLGLGYTTVVTTWSLMDLVVEPFQAGKIWVVVPTILGLLVYAQFTKNYKWVVRWPLALLTSLGFTLVLVGIPLTRFLLQLNMLAAPLTTGSAFDVVNAIILIVGVATIMSYFTFTREHKGMLGISAKIGRYFLMTALGAGLAMSILSQGTWFVSVIVFLLRDWLGILV